jgi:hypothetical protein
MFKILFQIAHIIYTFNNRKVNRKGDSNLATFKFKFKKRSPESELLPLKLNYSHTAMEYPYTGIHRFCLFHRQVHV